MFCSKCGTQIAEGAKFCHNCGIKVAVDSGSPTETQNAKSVKDVDLLITFKDDAGLDFSGMNIQKLDVDIDGKKMRKLQYGETIVCKIALGKHHIILGSTHIWIDTSAGIGPVRLTIRSTVQEGVLKHQLICEPGHLVIPAPRDNSEESGSLVQDTDNYSQEQYQGTRQEAWVCHRCGTEIDKKTEFCYKCGATIRYKEHEPRLSKPGTVESDDESMPKRIQPRNRLECPNCHSSDLIPLSETKTDISGGGYRAGRGCCGWILLGPLGLLCGLCGTGIKSESKTITFWVCRDCGNKFRSPRDMEAEKFSEGVNECLTLLKGAVIFHIVGNILNDYNFKFLGIPNWIYITIGAIGITSGVLWFLGLTVEKLLNDMDSLEEADEKEFFRNFMSGATSYFIFFLAVFIGGILSAGMGIRFFWIPAWIYILVSILGMIVSAIAMVISWRMGLDDEKAEEFDAKLSTLLEKIMRKIKRE